MFPNFLIIGAAKAGTTSLYQYVRSHPQAFMPAKKELSFFCEEFHWNRGLGWYEAQFEGAESAIAVGEASPRYTVFPLYEGVPARIARLIPDVRLIYLVREPIKRMQSHYLERVVNGKERRPIAEALLTDPFYLTSSRYALQIRQYLEHFPREQLLVIRSEDMRSRKEAILSQVFDFIGIDPTWRSDVTSADFLVMSERTNPRPAFRRIWYSPTSARIARIFPRRARQGFRTLTSRRLDTARAEISPSVRHRLEELLNDDVRDLHEFLGGSFDGWGLGS